MTFPFRVHLMPEDDTQGYEEEESEYAEYDSVISIQTRMFPYGIQILNHGVSTRYLRLKRRRSKTLMTTPPIVKTMKK